MNVVTLIGNLASDVELRDVGEDRQVANFLLAVNRPGKDEADFVRISTWNKQAETCAQYLAKGKKVGGRRSPQEQLVGGRGRKQAERGRGRREPRRSSCPRRPERRRPRTSRSKPHQPRIGRSGRSRRDPRLRRRAARARGLPGLRSDGPAGRRRTEVSRLACGVSASLELFERTAAAGAQMLLVHHGLLWDNQPRVIDDALRRRLKALLDPEITLAAYHLALDAHPEVGNNALLARELGIEPEVGSLTSASAGR